MDRAPRVSKVWIARRLALIVAAVYLILMSIAVPLDRKTTLRAKESVLKNNLFTMRTVIDEYTLERLAILPQADDPEVRSAAWLLTKVLGDDVTTDENGPPAPAQLFRAREQRKPSAPQAIQGRVALPESQQRQHHKAHQGQNPGGQLSDEGQW